MSDNRIRVTVWYEFRQEKYNPEVAALFPKGIHGCVGDILSECDDVEVRLAAPVTTAFERPDGCPFVESIV